MIGACANAKASVLVVVEIDGQALKFKQDGALFANNIEVAILAMDESGKIRDGAKDTAELKLRPETHALVVKNGVRLTRRLALAARQLPAADRRARERRRPGRVGHVRPRRAGLQQGGPLDGWSAAHRPRRRGRMPTANPDRRLQGDPARLADRAPRVPVRRSADAGRRRLRQQGLDAAPRRDPDDRDRRQRQRGLHFHRRAPHRGAERRQRARSATSPPFRSRAWRPDATSCASRRKSLLSNGADRRARGRVHRYADGRRRDHRARRRQPARRASPLPHPRSPGVQRRLDGARRPERGRAARSTSNPGWWRRSLPASVRRPGSRSKSPARGAKARAARGRSSTSAPRSRARRRAGDRLAVPHRHAAARRRRVRFNVPDPGGHQTIVFKPPSTRRELRHRRQITRRLEHGPCRVPSSDRPITSMPVSGRSGSSFTGLTPHVAASLAYLAGPFSGALLLATETESRFVRFHAWQAVVGLGAARNRRRVLSWVWRSCC